MFLSFRRSKDALLALGFFVLMVVIVFSTLLYVRTLSSLYGLGSSSTRQGILSSAVPGTTPLKSSSTRMAIHPSLQLVPFALDLSYHVSQTAYMLVHTRRSVVRDP